MVDSSLLEPVIQLRREDSSRAALIQKLAELVKVSTLDTGQFHSFLSALQNPVHCTQGPPGSGKSYIGVVIVRALLIIRKLWIIESPIAGSPPILILSYKNHAIDEFLVDLLKFEKRSLRLIRLGGKSDHPDLGQYSERNVVNRDPKVLACQTRAEAIHTKTKKATCIWTL